MQEQKYGQNLATHKSDRLPSLSSYPDLLPRDTGRKVRLLTQVLAPHGKTK